ncbi:MAG: hypothetical protein JW863_21345 [Chitinispirillaceae bacterium]|nr:hypothetical protein [Chitinispirillaceae bacterium]
MIRLALAGLTVIATVLQGAAVQKSRIVIPVRDRVGVYRNETRKVFESPLFTVGTKDRLQVLEKGKRNSKVIDADKREGWIENRLCVTAPGNRLYTFDPALIEQYMDTKNAMIIFDGLPPEEGHIRLDRSFKDALSENVDRETIGRMCCK